MRKVRKFAEILQRAIEGLTDLFLRMACLSVILLIAFMAVEVSSRYILRSSTSWSFELSTLSFGAIFLLGTAGALKYGHHVRMDLMYQRLSAQNKRIMDAIIYAFLLLPCLFLLGQQLWMRFWETFQSGETTGYSAWNPPLWPFAVMVAVGVSVLTLQIVAEILKVITEQSRENDK